MKSLYSSKEKPYDSENGGIIFLFEMRFLDKPVQPLEQTSLATSSCLDEVEEENRAKVGQKKAVDRQITADQISTGKNLRRLKIHSQKWAALTRYLENSTCGLSNEKKMINHHISLKGPTLRVVKNQLLIRICFSSALNSAI